MLIKSTIQQCNCFSTVFFLCQFSFDLCYLVIQIITLDWFVKLEARLLKKKIIVRSTSQLVITFVLRTYAVHDSIIFVNECLFDAFMSNKLKGFDIIHQ